MFNTLRQGSTVYVLNKVNDLKLNIGQVVSVVTNQPYFNNPLNSTIDITVTINGETLEFKQIPSNLSIANYGNLILAETKDLMCQEVENILKNSKQIIENIQYHRELIKSCDDILSQLNPKFAKDKERDDEIKNIKNQVLGMESKLDKVLELIAKK